MSETARRTKCTAIVPWNEVWQSREQVCRSNTTKFQPDLIDSASSIAHLRKWDSRPLASKQTFSTKFPNVNSWKHSINGSNDGTDALKMAGGISKKKV